jgi:hypothetical protein
MRNRRGLALLVSFVLLSACARTVLVPVPPRIDLAPYGTLGIAEFASNASPAIDVRATRQFQERVQAAQPGTRFIELGSRGALLAAVGGKQLDPDTLRKIGQKYGVAAVFVGDIVYSEPKTGVRITDLARLEGDVRTDVRGDISTRLVETRTGASVWSSSAWATRQLGRLNVSGSQGVSGGMRNDDPREAMLPAMLHHLTQDFRPTSVRQPAK